MYNLQILTQSSFIFFTSTLYTSSTSRVINVTLTNQLSLFSMSGALEFYDLNEVTCINVGEHFTATDVEWDPSGRYVSTSVSWWAQKVN